MASRLGQVVENESVQEERRQRVQSMRLRRLSTKAIAAVLQESEATIAADLEWIRANHARQFGAVPEVDASQEIGWAVADFEEMEQAAWMEFHALKAEAQQRKLSPMFVARARQGWIRTAAMMRVLRIKLLAEHGMLMPAASSQIATPVARADDLRAMLRQEGLLLEVAEAASAKPPAAVLDVPKDDPDDEDLGQQVAQWLDDGGVGVGVFD